MIENASEEFHTASEDDLDLALAIRTEVTFDPTRCENYNLQMLFQLLAKNLKGNTIHHALFLSRSQQLYA